MLLLLQQQIVGAVQILDTPLLQPRSTLYSCSSAVSVHTQPSPMRQPKVLLWLQQHLLPAATAAAAAATDQCCTICLLQAHCRLARNAPQVQVCCCQARV
jgi:hypothetical protein